MMTNSFFLLDYIGKAESFPLFLSQNLLILILGVPLFSIFFIFFTSGYDARFHYTFALNSTVLSFLLALYL